MRDTPRRAAHRFHFNLQRYVDCPERTVNGATVRAALEEVFGMQPRVRDYVLDAACRWTRKLVVARTRDGGRSFTVLRNGLSQEHARKPAAKSGMRTRPAHRR